LNRHGLDRKGAVWSKKRLDLLVVFQTAEPAVGFLVQESRCKMGRGCAMHHLHLFLADSWIKSAKDSMWSEEGRDPDDHFLGFCWSFDCPPRGASGVCEGGGRVGSSRALGDSSDCPSPSDCPSLSDCHCLRDLNVRLDAFSLSGFSVRSCPFRHHSFCGQNGFLTSSVL